MFNFESNAMTIAEKSVNINLASWRRLYGRTKTALEAIHGDISRRRTDEN